VQLELERPGAPARGPSQRDWRHWQTRRQWTRKSLRLPVHRDRDGARDNHDPIGTVTVTNTVTLTATKTPGHLQVEGLSPFKLADAALAC
jgi:hypothetical protein